MALIQKYMPDNWQVKRKPVIIAGSNCITDAVKAYYYFTGDHFISSAMELRGADVHGMKRGRFGIKYKNITEM